MKTLKKGAKGAEVTALKQELMRLGYELNDAGVNRGIFGAKVDRAVRDFQESAGLTVDGWAGPVTMAAIEKAIAVKPVPPVVDDQPVVVDPGIGQMPPWVAHLLSRLGWTEFSHDKEIAKDWPLTGLNYTTVIGRLRAWCGLAGAKALKVCKLPFPKDAAGAYSWEAERFWSEACGYITGAFLPLRHSGGGRHITVFMYWIDEKKKIAACLGGNQNNGYRISVYNLSGNKAGHDEVMGGPRWPKGFPQSGYQYPKNGKVDTGSQTT